MWLAVTKFMALSSKAWCGSHGASSASSSKKWRKSQGSKGQQSKFHSKWGWYGFSKQDSKDPLGITKEDETPLWVTRLPKLYFRFSLPTLPFLCLSSCQISQPLSSPRLLWENWQTIQADEWVASVNKGLMMDFHTPVVLSRTPI